MTSFADLIYRPFEQFVKPLDLPIRPLPDTSPMAVVLHFAGLFRWVLVAVAALSVLSGLVGLATVWAIAYIVDGVTTLGPAAFLAGNVALLALFLVLIAVVDPLFVFVQSALMSQTVSVGFPAAMRWQGTRPSSARTSPSSRTSSPDRWRRGSRR